MCLTIFLVISFNLLLFGLWFDLEDSVVSENDTIASITKLIQTN
jgi:hypothetical protein